MSHDTPVPEPEREPVPKPAPDANSASEAAPDDVPEAVTVAAPAPVAADLPAVTDAPVTADVPAPADVPVLTDVSLLPAPPALPPLPAPLAPAYKPRRRGRTTLLIASAAVLGVLAGGGLGYRIQQNREPTPLPPLTGPMLTQPKGAGIAPARAVGEDRDAVYQGNLLKLLVPTPKGAKEDLRGWMSLRDYAESFERPAAAFRNFADNDYQRGARAAWRDQHEAFVAISLTQFRDEAVPFAPEHFMEQQAYADEDPELGSGHAVPGVSSGDVWGSAKVHQEAGYLPEYEARGMAQVGNIFVEIYVNSLHPVPYSTVMSVMKKQLERL